MRNPERGEGSTGVVAIVAILLMVFVAGFIAWRTGVFGGGSNGSHHSLDVNVNSK